MASKMLYATRHQDNPNERISSNFFSRSGLPFAQNSSNTVNISIPIFFTQPEMIRSLIGDGLAKEFVEFCKMKIISLEDVILGNSIFFTNSLTTFTFSSSTCDNDNAVIYFCDKSH